MAARSDATVDTSASWTDLGYALAGYAGEPVLAFAWPDGIPGGTDIYMQFVIFDPAAPAMYALSNALQAHTLRS